MPLAARSASRPAIAGLPAPTGARDASALRPSGARDGLAQHDATEGFRLVASTADDAPAGAGCSSNAPVRDYAIAAIGVDITLNRFGDHDDRGRMFVLASDIARVRNEERRNTAARAGHGEFAVSLGLSGDAIQPLTLRVVPGECLRLSLDNQLPNGEPASLHLHGAALRVARDGSAAIATNLRATAAAGGRVAYEWMVGSDEPEGTHYFHSHGNTREQTSHGLFGAVIVEPARSTWFDPSTGAALASGWTAIVHTPDAESAGGRAQDFREFALFYHEIGNESYQIRDRSGAFVPLVDPILGAYRPGTRALNYRSEPFANRMALQARRARGHFDESLAYSSYAFGDPATPIMRAYLGDHVKQRVIHGGSEVFHVHHVHGGAIRWRRQPGAELVALAGGLDKHPPLVPTASERTDAQTLGPSETFDIENECGSGGCQQSVGDFLYHCHVAHHYFAGMWGIWRVYNTRQDRARATDSLGPLQELSSRRGQVASAVTSDQLTGGRRFLAHGSDALAAWVERQLPPRGVPKGYDASVMDWQRQGNRYVGEPEATRAWPGYRPRAPGARPPLLFDPRTGKLAYPFLRPHFGKRPPFAPNHGPAPFLDPPAAGATDPPKPGAGGAASVCPAGTKQRAFSIRAISVPIAINQRAGIVDPFGEIFVLTSREKAARADNRLRTPLAIRANAGEDCVDVALSSALADDAENHGFSKVNLHIHFVQFDVQASDGVVAGFNYEQSVRPFARAGARLTAPALAGARAVHVADATRFSVGSVVAVGIDRPDAFEARRIVAIAGSSVSFDRPLGTRHAKGETVSAEFVRYRWYPDVQFGTAYFHDHVNALKSWTHGLFGALIAEPPGSTYHDPHTGAEIQTGAIADIRTRARVSVDVTGSFRELVMFIQDDNPLTRVDRSSGSAFNMRAEPLDPRARDDPSMLFSSRARGDPETPLLEAFTGDPIVVRALVGATNDVHTWHVDGHWFRAEPWSVTSPPISTVHVGISERFDLVLPRAGGAQLLPGDYLYYSGRTFKLREGSWGLIRVRAAGGGLRALPGHEPTGQPAAASLCPPGAPARAFDVHAIDVGLPMLGGALGKVYVLARDVNDVRTGKRAPEPLVLRANVGDCIRVSLTNETKTGAVSFHTDMLAFDPASSAGVAAGNEPAQTVAPGQTRTYEFYAPPEVGETVAMVRDFGDVLHNPQRGLYGAIVVGPAGARYQDPLTRRAVDDGWNVTVIPPKGAPYRDVSLFFQDEDAGIGTHRMPYSVAVSGPVGLNYRKAPLPNGLRSDQIPRDPATPIIEAFIGDPVRLHVLVPSSEQAHVFSVEGHRWPQEPGLRGTNLLSSITIGGLEAITLPITAGGTEHLAGDYLYGDHREPYREAGLWGILRVVGPCARATVAPLGRTSCPKSVPWLPIAIALAGALVAAFVARARRRKHPPFKVSLHA